MENKEHGTHRGSVLKEDGRGKRDTESLGSLLFHHKNKAENGSFETEHVQNTS